MSKRQEAMKAVKDAGCLWEPADAFDKCQGIIGEIVPPAGFAIAPDADSDGEEWLSSLVCFDYDDVIERLKYHIIVKLDNGKGDNFINMRDFVTVAKFIVETVEGKRN